MDESFYRSEEISAEMLRGLMRRDNQPALVQFLVMYGLVIGTGVWAVLAWNTSWWNIMLSQLGFGVMVCSTFACLHESAHGTAFASRRLNRIVALLAGLVHLYPSSLFRELHFTHHRHTHVPGLDPEITLGNRPAPSVLANLPVYLGWLTGFPLLMFKIVRQGMRMRIALESLLVLSFQLGLLVLAITVEPGLYAIFVGQIVGHCLLAAYLAPEHNGLPHEGDILEKTRSMDTHRWVKLLMWNMPYHAEHHAFPAVPFHALPRLREQLESRLKHKTDGYSRFHFDVIRSQTKH